ncbi:hypothetical protein LJR220_001657 [Bradyrhizobium sp. LjRoot220]|uniref:hypothetical protein n=1 Tax=Bradyrhizobium sp. LjRoot220 TaxID=3342284 RepID=UPI003ECE5E78
MKPSTRFLLFTFVCAVVLGPASAQETDYDRAIQEAYKLGEDDARSKMADFQKGAKVEAERKKRAGEPAVSPETVKQGHRVSKFLVHNRTAIRAICAATGLKNKRPFSDVEACVAAKSAAMAKYLKLDEYVDNKTRKNCELKARDFDTERRIPPFEFLADGFGPPILDFDIANACMLAGR